MPELARHAHALARARPGKIVTIAPRPIAADQFALHGTDGDRERARPHRRGYQREFVYGIGKEDGKRQRGHPAERRSHHGTDVVDAQRLQRRMPGNRDILDAELRKVGLVRAA